VPNDALGGRRKNDQALQAYIAAFREGLAKLGLVEERNLRIDQRFSGPDADRFPWCCPPALSATIFR
jgi:hypothetical protein